MYSKYGLLVLASIFSVAILLIDITFPLGVAGGILLISAVLVGLWFPNPRQIIIITIITAVMTIAGYLLSPSGSENWIVFTNRALTLFSLILTGTLLFVFKTKGEMTASQNQNNFLNEDSAFKIVGAWRSAGALVIILSVLIITFMAIKETERSLQWVRHTHEVQTELAKVLSKLQDAETGQRGFLLTGEEHYLEPFDQAVNEIIDAITGLQFLTHDNRTQKLRVTALLPLAQKKIRELNETISLRRSNGLPAALEVVKTGAGKNIMDEIRLIVMHVEKEETRLLEERELRFDDLRYFATATYLLLIAMVIGFPVYIVYRVRQFSSYRRRTDNLLKKAKETAETANAAKSKFLSSMSHELRTPMNSILGFTQLIQVDPQHPLTEKQRESTDLVLKSGNHLLQLIDDVLDLSTIEAGHMNLDKVVQNPSELVHDCCNVVSGLVLDKEVTFYNQTTHYDLPEIDVDGTRFRQVLINLLSNAIKYNRPNGSVTLTVLATTDNNLRFNVSDTGLGIPKDSFAGVFEPFSRLGMENSQVSGTGIGLSITRQLVIEMGGLIGFESKYNIGSNFWIEFPIVRGEVISTIADEHFQDRENHTLNPDARKILCVEDDSMSLLVMKEIVEGMLGMEMVSAHTGELGVDLAKSTRPDAIVMDINLPGMTGLEALAQLQNSDVTKEIPVIAVTARATEEDIQDGLNAGFRAYLTKPINIATVAESIKSATTTDSHQSPIVSHSSNTKNISDLPLSIPPAKKCG